MEFTKERRDAPLGFFEAEAAGLRWLASAGGARVVRVLGVEPGRIRLERISESGPSPEAAHRFGADLARTHDSGASRFGARPDGYSGPLYIGRRSMPTNEAASWGDFYVRARVEPFLTATTPRVVRDACDLIARGAFDDDEPPARIHGDLWNGNLLWSPDGAVLIDPAAHGGHRETDLAMLDLFGCAFLEQIIAGYESVHALRAGWRGRIAVHQLHPLAVHALGHGAHYGVALESAARAILALER